jgi:hypothetical protein
MNKNVQRECVVCDAHSDADVHLVMRLPVTATRQQRCRIMAAITQCWSTISTRYFRCVSSVNKVCNSIKLIFKQQKSLPSYVNDFYLTSLCNNENLSVVSKDAVKTVYYVVDSYHP